MNSVSFRVLPGFFLSLAFGLLLIPAPWVFGWFVAALWHESCHYVALKAVRCPVYAVSFAFGRIRMETEEVVGLKMVLCALAGPLGGLLLCTLLPIVPQIAICGLIQSLYNLLPVEPLDGGKALRGILDCVGNEDSVLQIMKYIRHLILALLFIAYVFCAIHYGKLPMICLGALFLKIFLANRSGWKYNSPIGYK